MMDHIARTAAAVDWHDETVEVPARQAEPEVAVHPEAPRLSDTEMFASLRHPFGRIRVQRDKGDASRAPAVETGSSDSPEPMAGGARVAAFPGDRPRIATEPRTQIERRAPSRHAWKA